MLCIIYVELSCRQMFACFVSLLLLLCPPTEGEGDILFLVRIPLVSRGAVARSEACLLGMHILSWRLGHEKISTATILPLPLIQEE